MPRLDPRLSWRDHLGTVGARTGVSRNDYLVIPGLYCLGQPGKDSTVLVTANYKLTVDHLRSRLQGLDVWVLVIDTRGINVWCAAGKGTFCAEEIAYQVVRTGLGRVVTHRRLLLPQLAAVGVAARELKHRCGFQAFFGPIEARDIRGFLSSGKASEAMRSVTFTMVQRAILIPLEIFGLWRAVCLGIPLLFLLSGVSREVFDGAAAVQRGSQLLGASVAAVLSGAVLTPLLLPFIPVRQFWLKGALSGLATAVLFLVAFMAGSVIDRIALGLWITGLSSYLAMNYTGSTPFTSLSGVELEMRRGLPFQIGSGTAALICWLISPFT